MSQAERFAQLLKEFERVGVDPNTISAGLLAFMCNSNLPKSRALSNWSTGRQVIQRSMEQRVTGQVWFWLNIQLAR